MTSQASRKPVAFTGALSTRALAEFAADGRVFVAEKSGIIKVFDSLTDTTPTASPTSERTSTTTGIAACSGWRSAPIIPGRIPRVYVLYTYDHILGDRRRRPMGPRWNGDGCPTPPGDHSDGCVVRGGSRVAGQRERLDRGRAGPRSRTGASSSPSHSIGSLAFGPDGALYVSGGDGASFNGVDYGQGGGTRSLPGGREPVRRPGPMRRGRS